MAVETSSVGFDIHTGLTASVVTVAGTTSFFPFPTSCVRRHHILFIAFSRLPSNGGLDLTPRRAPNVHCAQVVHLITLAGADPGIWKGGGAQLEAPPRGGCGRGTPLPPSYGVRGSAVSSPIGVWGEAP